LAGSVKRFAPARRRVGDWVALGKLLNVSMNRPPFGRDYSCEPSGRKLHVTRSSREIYDELLIMRCRQQDLAAWDELVRRWNDRLLYYLRRLIDHEQDATNALQDVWLHAFRGIRTLRDGSRLAPWLYTIARRTAMNHLRRDYALREESSPETLADEVDDVPDERLRLESAELVHFGLGKLGLPGREVLTLYFLEDLSIGEMAELLGVPAGTVKSRLFKARRDLRRILEREAERHES
jgi:RNA polymerase sigma-70 factor (ECF subfamily)